MQKQLYIYLYYVTIVLTAFLFLAILPNFTFNIPNGYKVEWRGLSSLGISENLFNFTRGKGVYTKKHVELTAQQEKLSDQTFLLSFAQDRRAITGRLALINNALNADLYAREYVLGDTTRTLVLEFPEYINRPEVFAKDLTSKGNARIVVSGDAPAPANGANQSLLNLYFQKYQQPTDSGIQLHDVQNFSIDSSPLFTVPILRTNFAASTSSTLEQAFAKSEYDSNGTPITPVVLMVDDQPMFWAFHPDLFRTKVNNTNDTFPTNIIWIPIDRDVDKLGLAVKAASLVGDKVNLTYQQSDVTSINPDYAPEGRVFIAATFIFLCALVIARAISQLRLRGAIYFGIGMAASIVTAISFAKLGNIPIDPLTLTTISTFIIIMNVLFLDLLVNHLESFNKYLTNHINIAIILFLISAVLFQIPAFRLVHGFEVIVVMAITWFIAALIYFRAIAGMYYRTKYDS